MLLEREIVEFPGPDGANLVGILWLPPPGVPRNNNTLFILSHGGLSHKPGAHRAQYHLARYFTSRGCTVFRFDPAGMGDSDGTIQTNVRQDLFGSIASGLFRESHHAAFDYLATRFANYKWILSGVCGGAISSLLAGVESPYPIAGYALISCSVVLDGSRFDYSRREPPATALRYMRLYLPKLVNPTAIWRFVSGQSEYARMWTYSRSLFLRGKDNIAAKLGWPRKVVSADTDKPDAAKPPVGLNPIFVKAARQAIRRSKVLFIYGDNDGFLWDFTDLYATNHLSDSQRARVLRVVAHANHMFIWQEWQQQAFELIDGWLVAEM
jgi:pimeloyl-ACP methyl ester carboxylesterase